VAARYRALLREIVIGPDLLRVGTSVWAQYTEQVRSRCGDGAAQNQGGADGVYYAKPLHRQIGYRGNPIAGNGLPVKGKLASEVLSLPMHPYLTRETQARIAVEMRRAFDS
jgi:dTDP-4-amino-4,6-dideoxygalactose transaminase